jgi:hypothetical protein
MIDNFGSNRTEKGYDILRQKENSPTNNDGAPTIDKKTKVQTNQNMVNKRQRLTKSLMDVKRDEEKNRKAFKGRK